MKNQSTISPELENIMYLTLSPRPSYIPPGSNPMTDIVDAVCREYGLRSAEVLNEIKSECVSECRFVCMKILYERKFSPKRIGEMLGVTRRAVYHGLRKIEDYLQTIPVLRQRIEYIEDVLV